MAEDLFQSGGLEQNTGVISERWNQSGSVPVSQNLSATTTPQATFTVTAGKTFYMTDASAYDTASTTNRVLFEDDSTSKLSIAIGAANTIYPAVFRAPIAFTTNVTLTADENSAVVFFSGWEE